MRGFRGAFPDSAAPDGEGTRKMTEAKCGNCGAPILYEVGSAEAAEGLSCPRCAAPVAPRFAPTPIETVSIAEAIASLGSTVGLDPYRTGTIVLEPEGEAAAAAEQAAQSVEVKVRGFLKQLGLPPEEADFRLRGGVTVVGRQVGDLVVDDPSISARHFQIEERGGQFYLRDLGSSNGTFLNDREVRSAPLQSGDRIQAGSTLFTFSVRHTIPT